MAMNSLSSGSRPMTANASMVAPHPGLIASTAARHQARIDLTSGHAVGAGAMNEFDWQPWFTAKANMMQDSDFWLDMGTIPAAVLRIYISRISSGADRLYVDTAHEPSGPWFTIADLSVVGSYGGTMVTDGISGTNIMRRYLRWRYTGGGITFRIGVSPVDNLTPAHSAQLPHSMGRGCSGCAHGAKSGYKLLQPWTTFSYGFDAAFNTNDIIASRINWFESQGATYAYHTIEVPYISNADLRFQSAPNMDGPWTDLTLSGANPITALGTYMFKQSLEFASTQDVQRFARWSAYTNTPGSPAALTLRWSVQWA